MSSPGSTGGISRGTARPSPGSSPSCLAVPRGLAGMFPEPAGLPGFLVRCRGARARRRGAPCPSRPWPQPRVDFDRAEVELRAWVDSRGRRPGRTARAQDQRPGPGHSSFPRLFAWSPSGDCASNGTAPWALPCLPLGSPGLPEWEGGEGAPGTMQPTNLLAKATPGSACESCRHSPSSLCRRCRPVGQCSAR